jgi:hypothetical protein
MRRHVGWVLLATPALIASWGCVPDGSQVVVTPYKDAKFNERVAGDLYGLGGDERQENLRFGLFRDGTEDPDGPDEPRTGGLISEIVPMPADGKGLGNLVQTPCLFVGRRGSYGDRLWMTWEVNAQIDLDRASGPVYDGVHQDLAWVGTCTMLSGPESRLINEHPGAPYDPAQFAEMAASPLCRSARTGSTALTLHEDPSLNRNVPWPCRFVDHFGVRLEAFSPVAPDPDGACPAEPFTGGPTPVPVDDCMSQGDLAPVCAKPCAVFPSGDASYRVRIDPGTVLALPAAERLLHPAVMVVDGQRTLVRPMEATGDSYSWQAKVVQQVEPPTPMEKPIPVQWSENYSPTVVVDTVQVLVRDASGGEQVLRPANDRLIVEIPRSLGIATLHCTGTSEPGGFTFSLSACAESLGEEGEMVFSAITPTYLVHDHRMEPAVERPIVWRATLDPAPAEGGSVFVRFGVRAVTMGDELRAAPAVDFGRIPEGEYRQQVVELENLGDAAAWVTEVFLHPGVGHPQDFTAFVVGDPVPMPLPLEAEAQADGTVGLRLVDLADAPLVGFADFGDATVVSLGDPSLPPGEPQPLTLYGQRALLRGSVLTRDDPAATFEPPAGSLPRPFVVPAYAELQPPFLLGPGERRKIVVETRPTAQGLRHARLFYRWVTPSSPQQVRQMDSALLVDVASGPLLRFHPYSLHVHRDANASQPGHLNALLQNLGHFDMAMHSIQVIGRDAARFVATTDRGGLGPFVLPPGDSLLVRVEYLPECDGSYGTPMNDIDHEATLLVSSDGGTGRIPLTGASGGFCNLP